MSFLKPEPKSSTWKSITRSAEFKQFMFIALLAVILITFMIIMVARWEELFPSEKKPAEDLNALLPATYEARLDQVAPSTQPVTPTPPSAIPRLTIPKIPEILDNVQDRTPLEQDEFYNSLLGYVLQFPPEEISSLLNPDIKYQDLMEEPQKYRGQFIRVKGVLMVLEARGDLQTNPGDIKYYYLGMVGSSTRNEYYRFHLIDKPYKYTTVLDRVGHADDVWVEGAFFKIIRYQRSPRTGGGYAEIPFLIGRRMGRVRVSTPGVTTLSIVMGILIILAVSGILIALFIGTRKDKDYQQKRMEKWKKSAEKKKQKPAEKPPSEEKPQ